MFEKNQRTACMHTLQVVSYGKGLCPLPRTPSIDEILLTFRHLLRCKRYYPPTLLNIIIIITPLLSVITAAKQPNPPPHLPYHFISAEDVCGRRMLDYLDVAFNVLLEPCLLYASERSQLAKLRDKEPNLSPSTIYGGEHLLRLLLIIPT